MKYNYQGKIGKIEQFLIRARDLIDELDYNVCEDINPDFTLLDSKADNGARQCIDRALHLLDMASYEILRSAE